jgi:hypothetical protein
MSQSYRRNILNQILTAGKRIALPFSLNQEKAYRQQMRTLRKLMTKAEHTAFGKQYHFSEVLASKSLYKSLKQHVPLMDYGKMHEWWQQAYNGQENVTWPGKVEYFALSSGTSEGSSKYIPISQDMIKSITKASLRQIISIAKTDIPKDFLTKDYLMMSGSTSLYFNDEGKTYAGDLSGITSGRVPGWFDRFSKPSHDIRSEKSWHNKIDRMVEEAPGWDVVAIAGVPAWIQILFEKIIERYNLKNIHDLWPNFSVYIWGGVAIDPYRKSLDKLLGQPIMYFETYLASEGFVAYQAKKESEGMRLNFRNGMFFEFIPFDESNFDEQGNMRPEASSMNIKQVELGKEYALILTTCSGTWRYMIGDTIRFVDLDLCEIKITGRTKHFLSLCGEHLSVDNMNQAISMLSDTLDAPINEYTVKGKSDANGKHSHHWYIACDKPGLDPQEVKILIDKYLVQINDDYATERKHALSDIYMTILPSEKFIGWMQEQGKFGSQNKFPRVLTNEKYNEWVNYLNVQEKSVVNG